MCDVLLPPSVNPTAVKYISYHIRVISSGMCGMDWIELAQDRDRRRAFVTGGMNLRDP
jgi:hypothetical protein